MISRVLVGIGWLLVLWALVAVLRIPGRAVDIYIHNIYIPLNKLTLFALIFLFSLVKGFVHTRRRQFAQHREWMLRAFAVGLAIATIRPINGIFFATSRLTHLTPQEFFGTAFWIGFTVQLIAAEVWINYTRGRISR